MNATNKRLPTRFAPETRFAIQPVAPAPFRRMQETKLEELKLHLLGQRLEEILDPADEESVRSAANESAALAWVSAYPLLVFPALFEELADAALARAERQSMVFRRSRLLLAV